MGDFQRNSSRFNRGGGNGGGSSGGGSRSGGGGGGGFQRRSGGGGGNYQGRGGSGGGRSGGAGGGDQQNGEFAFTKIADLTVPKSAGDDVREFVDAELDGTGLTLNAKIYLGKGDNELTLKNGDMLIIRFKKGAKAPEFSKGTVSVKN